MLLAAYKAADGMKQECSKYKPSHLVVGSTLPGTLLNETVMTDVRDMLGLSESIEETMGGCFTEQHVEDLSFKIVDASPGAVVMSLAVCAKEATAAMYLNRAHKADQVIRQSLDEVSKVSKATACQLKELGLPDDLHNAKWREFCRGAHILDTPLEPSRWKPRSADAELVSSPSSPVDSKSEGEGSKRSLAEEMSGSAGQAAKRARQSLASSGERSSANDGLLEMIKHLKLHDQAQLCCAIALSSCFNSG